MTTQLYTNLPQKEKDKVSEAIEKLKQTQYEEPFEMDGANYDATIAFFVKRGFDRQPAEDVAYIILQQAKIDSVSPAEIIDSLTYASPAQLSELITIVLNANRYKSSKLGIKSTRTTKDSVSRNILD